MHAAPLRSPDRAWRALLALSVLAVIGFAAATGAAPWRALYAGQIGTEFVVIDLTLAANDLAYASVQLNARHLVLSGVGTAKAVNTVEVDLTTAAPRPSQSFAILYAELSPDEQPAPEPGYHLSGALNPSWQDDGANLTLTLTVAGVETAGTLPRVAQYSELRLAEGRVESSSAWPRFAAPALKRVSGSLEAQAYEQVGTFVGEGRSGVDDGALGWAWRSDGYVDVIGVAGDYLSLLVSTSTDTGGAHGNTYFSSALYDLGGGGATPLALAELFSPDTGWEAAVTSWVTNDLLRQEATWIQGGAVITLHDLSTFTLGPTGLTFVFDPYAVGPYVQGAFAVTLPYALVAPLAPVDGAVAAFAAALSPTALR